jgi:hypothetical protein
MVPEYMTKEWTLEWLDAIDPEFSAIHRNLYTIPYYLWEWGELDRLREFMIKANTVRPGFNEAVWNECRWRIPLAHPEVDTWEMQKMIFVYGYMGP